MSVLPYVKRVLETYAGGGEDYLSQVLVDGHYDETFALARNTEQISLLIGTMLASGRMQSSDITADQEVAWVRKVAEAVKVLDDDLPAVTVPTKSELVELGVLNLILERLKSGNDRISRLNLLEIILPSRAKHLQELFSEAHFNYLLGNWTATATLCRALLEAALKERVPGEMSTDGRIFEAQRIGKLDAERCARAHEIVTRGNNAVHQNKAFFSYSDQQISDLLINVRKVLEDLYKEL